MVRASGIVLAPGGVPTDAQRDGDVLVDGGILDNMPVGIMRSEHNGINVIAIDVGSQRDAPCR